MRFGTMGILLLVGALLSGGCSTTSSTQEETAEEDAQAEIQTGPVMADEGMDNLQLD